MPTSSKVKTVLVTGAASGIGKATAMLFAKQGFRVALLDLSSSPLEKTCGELDKQNLEHKFYFADVSSSKDLSEAFLKIENDFGSLDAAVNNAGIDNALKKFVDFSESDFDKVVAVNLKGVFFCLQHEVRMMLKAERGAIVNVASMLGLVGSPGLGIYSATKHGVVGLTKSLAVEVARKGIRVNAVCPGGVETNMIKKTRELSPKVIENTERLHALGRFADPSEIANAIFWLCSDESSFVVGTGLSVDGGYTAI